MAAEHTLIDDEMLAQAIAMSLQEAENTSSPPPVFPPATQQTSTPQPTTPSPIVVAQPPPPTQQEENTLTTNTIANEASDIARVILSREEPQNPQPATGKELPPVVLMKKEWEPNRECLDLVMGMGISENAARRALYNTGNDNAELATSWVFENIDNPELHTQFNPPPISSPAGVAKTLLQQGGPVWHSFDDALVGAPSELYKMAFVINAELKMGVGKIAAQVGHATLALYRLLQTQPQWKEQCTKWEETASTKITVQGQSTHHLLELKHKAYELRLPSIIVHDAGKTQVEPGSLTVFAVFGKVEDVNEVTGKLKLL